MDWTHTERRIASKNSHRRKNEREKNKRKDKTDDVKLDDERWLQKTEGGGSTAEGVATSDIWTCLRWQSTYRRLNRIFIVATNRLYLYHSRPRDTLCSCWYMNSNVGLCRCNQSDFLSCRLVRSMCTVSEDDVWTMCWPVSGCVLCRSPTTSPQLNWSLQVRPVQSLELNSVY